MKITNEQVIGLYKTLMFILNTNSNLKLPVWHTFKSNLSKLDFAFKSFAEVEAKIRQDRPKDYDDYEIARSALLAPFPKTNNDPGRVQIPDDKVQETLDALKNLDSKYATVLEKVNESDAYLGSLLSEEVDVDLKTLKMSQLANMELSSKSWDHLSIIIEDLE
jgi:hypothetical protein